MEISTTRSPNPNTFYFLSLLIIGIILLKPQTGFLPFLSQGDHGLNLYAAQVILKGAIPYQDFSWPYGPLMLYYYAAFLKIFGGGIQNILLGKTLLILGSGFLIYFNLALFVPRLISATGAIWFWIFFKDFPYTFNHAGGIPVLLLISFFTFCYIKSPKPKFLYYNLFMVLFLSLIKLNLSFAALIALVIIIYINNSILKKHSLYFYFLFLIALPAAIILIYWWLVRDLPFYYINQCLPYFGTYFKITGIGDANQRNIVLNIMVNGYELIKTISSSWANITLALLINIAILRCLILWRRKDLAPNYRKEILLAFFATILFYIFCLHEFLIIGVFYQAYWAASFKILLMFGIIGFALHNANRFMKIIVALIILTIAFVQAFNDPMIFAQYKNPRTYFNFSETNIEIGNDPAWTQTVTKTTNYIQNHLKKDELFWAIPYDPLYYFLTQKPAPTKELMLIGIGIDPQQERQIIQDLENKKIAWIVLSNRGDEPGLAAISETYCPTIAKYIHDNFIIEAQFGTWNATPFWWSNHGTKILKRIK